MTPKEKAIDLYNRHYNMIYDEDSKTLEHIVMCVLAKRHAHYTASMCLQSTGNTWWDLVKQHIESM